jgi:hypothetical protein
MNTSYIHLRTPYLGGSDEGRTRFPAAPTAFMSFTIAENSPNSGDREIRLG